LIVRPAAELALAQLRRRALERGAPRPARIARRERALAPRGACALASRARARRVSTVLQWLPGLRGVNRMVYACPSMERRTPSIQP
jgi:hypothetical protein